MPRDVPLPKGLKPPSRLAQLGELTLPFDLLRYGLSGYHLIGAPRGDGRALYPEETPSDRRAFARGNGTRAPRSGQTRLPYGIALHERRWHGGQQRPRSSSGRRRSPARPFGSVRSIPRSTETRRARTAGRREAGLPAAPAPNGAPCWISSMCCARSETVMVVSAISVMPVVP